MQDRCFDRIEAQVFGEVASKDECLKPEVTFVYRRSAISAINKFLYHCRAHTLIWFDAQPKDVLRNGEGNEFWVAQSGPVRSPVRVPIELSAVNASLCGNREPSLALALLVSAKERLMLEQFHEGIVNLASM